MDGLVDLAAINAFLAYHHSKESLVVVVLADAYDTFDRRCEKSSARIVCCTPALYDKELRGSNNDVIGGYHKWLKARTQGITWLPKLKISSKEEAEVLEESEEVQALREKFERTSDNECFEGNNTEDPNIDFEQLISQAEEGEDEDWGLPPKLKRMVEQEDREVKPHQEEMEIVNLGVGEERKEVKVGTSMSTNIRDELVALLRNYQDIFAWSYQDMSDLSADIVTNIVLVPKKDGKVQMCMDYRDLNRASPKDNFPLQHIDILVDNTTNFALFSFMNGFSGYNQIKMAPEDMEKKPLSPYGELSATR
ncbi:uncharacterized protein [Glycine max]|uniref:uncharacterized protein n=1 Tax=Glycine max TaxID=3847 RepID=UPI000E21B446|nr:uncharacterized protein LOC113000183 [Glycine max]|eukprot:XP_025982644.1 uncharacterized protein LOC113000183 [Glycine max]